MEIDTTERLISAATRFEHGVDSTAPVPEPSRREKYLSRNLARTKANLLANEAVAAGAPPAPSQSLAQLAQERIIGSSDLFDINYLELAIAMGRSVARMEIGTA